MSGRWAWTVAMLALLMAAGPVQGRDLADIRFSGSLRICVAGSSAPFYRANAEAFARDIGVRAEVVTLQDWDQQFHNADGITVKEEAYIPRLLAEGRCDLFPNDLHMLDWRRSKMAFVPYYVTRKVVVAHRDLRPVLRTVEDLAGRVAAVQKGTAYETWLLQQNQGPFAARPMRIDLAPTADSMAQVAARRADFTVIGAEAAFKWVRGDLDNLVLLFAVDTPVAVGWGLHPAASDLAERLARFFADSGQVGSDLDESWRRTYGISLMEYQVFAASLTRQGTDGATNWRAVAAWAVPVGSALIGLLLGMAVWTRRLRREIAEHRATEAALRDAQNTLTAELTVRQAASRLLLDLQRVHTAEDFGRVLLSGLARHLDICQGLFCLVDDPAAPRAVAHYAGAPGGPAASLAALDDAALDEAGNGSLTARCLATGETLVIDRARTGGLRIRSGLGRVEPAAVVLFPLKHQGRLCGLLELACLHPISADHLRLLSEIEPALGLAINGLRRQV